MLPEIRIEIPELARFQAMLPRAPQIVGEELHAAMLESVLLAEGEIVTRTPVDTGRLRGAISSHVEGQGAEIRGVVSVANVPHAGYVEHGTGVFHEPDARSPWTVRPKRKKALRFTVGGQVFIRRAATIRGMRARHMFRDGGEAAKPGIRRIFARRLSRAARRISGQ